MHEQDVIWLAGLLEGEGCFTVRQPRPAHRAELSVRAKMTDRDVVERAAAVFPANTAITVEPRRDANHLHADCFSKSWYGADAERVMRAVLPHMCMRRTARIQECLSTPNLSHQP